MKSDGDFRIGQLVLQDADLPVVSDIDDDILIDESGLIYLSFRRRLLARDSLVKKPAR